MRKLGKFLKKFEKGVTLVEILVAATLLTMTAVGVISVFTTGYLVLHRIDTYHKATELAKHKISELQNIALETLYPANSIKDLDGIDETNEEVFSNYTGIKWGEKVLSELVTVGTVLPGSDAVCYCPVCGYVNVFHLIPTSTGGIRLYTPTCQNPDKNFDGNENDPCGAQLPRPGEPGFYLRKVFVYAHKQENWTEGLDDYDHYAPGDDPLARIANLKEVAVRVEWKAGGENYAFTLKTLFGLTTPKYGFK